MTKRIPKRKIQDNNVRFVPSITLKSGRVIYARDYGIRAFPIHD